MVRRLFLCPASIPSETQGRCLLIPASQDWLGVVNAALLQMTDEGNYEQVNDTDITPEEAAATAYQMFEAFIASECSDVTPPTLPLTSVFGYYLDAAAGAGNTTANTTYTRTFPSTMASEAPVQRGEDDYTFTCQPGYWHIRALVANATGDRSIPEIVDCTGTPMALAEGPNSANPIAEVEVYDYFTTGPRDFRIDQWFRTAATNGLGTSPGSVRGGFCAIVYFSWSEHKPGV